MFNYMCDTCMYIVIMYVHKVKFYAFTHIPPAVANFLNIFYINNFVLYVYIGTRFPWSSDWLSYQ